jgi:hypothetical protein
MRWEYGVLVLFMIGVIVLSVYRPHIDMSILENIPTEPKAPPVANLPKKVETEGTALTGINL